MSSSHNTVTSEPTEMICDSLHYSCGLELDHQQHIRLALTATRDTSSNEPHQHYGKTDGSICRKWLNREVV